jgi:hypothetical protein
MTLQACFSVFTDRPILGHRGTGDGQEDKHSEPNVFHFCTSFWCLCRKVLVILLKKDGVVSIWARKPIDVSILLGRNDAISI